MHGAKNYLGTFILRGVLRRLVGAYLLWERVIEDDETIICVDR